MYMYLYLQNYKFIFNNYPVFQGHEHFYLFQNFEIIIKMLMVFLKLSEHVIFL